MNNEYILITGASSGIGYDMAKIYAKQGEKLVLIARRVEILEKFKKDYDNIEIFSIDLSEKDSAKKIYEFTKSKNIFIKTLINNAGVGLYGDFIETDMNRETSMINLNIISLMNLTKLYLQDMLKENRGNILNVGSIAGFFPGPKMSIYYASKAFVTSFSKALRYELRKTNIKVSLLAPGPTNTEFVKSSSITSKKFFDTFKNNPSKYVAQYAIDNMGKKLIVPGFFNKISVMFSKIIPDFILLHMVNSIQEAK